MLKVKKREQENAVAKTMSDRVRLNVEMDEERRRALKVRAAMEGKTINEIINDLVCQYLQDGRS
jgi:predicted HicB family RNase H-like nuclease